MPQTITWRSRQAYSGIIKRPVEERVVIRGVNLTGDEQADRVAHGGRDKAVYAYAWEDYEYWTADEVGADDVLIVLSRPAHGVTLATMMDALQDDGAARRLSEIESLPPFWTGLAKRVQLDVDSLS